MDTDLIGAGLGSLSKVAPPWWILLNQEYHAFQQKSKVSSSLRGLPLYPTLKYNVLKECSPDIQYFNKCSLDIQ